MNKDLKIITILSGANSNDLTVLVRLKTRAQISELNTKMNIQSKIELPRSNSRLANQKTQTHPVGSPAKDNLAQKQYTYNKDATEVDQVIKVTQA